MSCFGFQVETEEQLSVVSWPDGLFPGYLMQPLAYRRSPTAREVACSCLLAVHLKEGRDARGTALARQFLRTQALPVQPCTAAACRDGSKFAAFVLEILI